MKTKINLKKTLAALCVLALLISVLPAMAFAEEMVEIPESDYIYVNGDSKVVTAQEEMALLRLTVETAGKFHILSSGVDISLVLFDEGADEVRGVYTSENGLMDVPFYAAPGMYLLGITGSGEVEILVADEAETERIYAAIEAEEPADKPAAKGADEAPAAEKPAFDPSVPVSYQAVIGKTVSVLEILKDAGAPIEAVTYVSGNVEGSMVSSANSVVLGDWLLTPCGYFDNITLTVKTVEDVEYTLVVSCPDPNAAPVEEAVEEIAEAAPAEEPEEEIPEEAPAEELVEEVPEEPVEEEVPEEAPVEEQPEEAPEEKQGFLSGFVNWLVGNPSDKDKEEAAAEEPAEEGEEEAAEEAADEPEEAEEPSEEEPAEEAEAEPAEEPEEAIPEKEVTIAVDRHEGNEIRLFAENMVPEDDETYAYQWQYSLDNENWLDVEGACERDYNFKLDSENCNYYWRLIVTAK